VLAAALAQLVVAHELVFAGTLPLVSLSHGHGHPVTLLAHEGHVDVVLHHESDASAPGATLEAEPSHEGDHVLHIASVETSAKRWQEGLPAAAAPPRGWVLAAVRPEPAAGPRALAPETRSMGPDLLRSTVLRV
jgi:hypothetical protein